MAARKLRVLSRCEDLTLRIYRITNDFPKDERFGLVAQMRRAAVSIGSNVAEGSETTRPAEFGRYLTIALGSIAEVSHQLRIGHRLGYIDEITTAETLDEAARVRRMLIALRSRIGAATRSS